MIKIYAAETEVSLFIYLLYILVLEILVCTSTVAVNVKMNVSDFCQTFTFFSITVDIT